MIKYTEYKYHAAALFTVAVWGATFVSTKVLIAHSLTPAEIFLLRFALAYVCIWPLSKGRLRADGWRDEALLAAADERTKLLWLCSPNNPTGNAFPAADIERLIRRFDGMVVLDEAYIDFASGPGFLARLDEFENLIVLQTLSKAWGMAGLRLGLAFAAEPVAELFARVKYPYNINGPTQREVLERLSRPITAQVAELRRERLRTARALADCRAIERIYPSEANFLLVRTAAPDRLYEALIRAGVIVRNRSRVAGCAGCLRITVGRPEENDLLIRTIQNFQP